MDDIITSKKKLSTKFSFLVNSFFHSIVKPHCYLCGSTHLDHFAICRPCYWDLPWITQSCVRCGLPSTKVKQQSDFGQHVYSGKVTYPKNLTTNTGRDRYHQLSCPDCTQTTFAFDRCIVLFRYEFPLPEIIHQYKYDKKRYWRRPLGQLIQHHGRVFKQQYYHDTTYPTPDIIIPVPIAGNKLRERGFNQASELAIYLGKLFSIKVQKNIIKRTDQSTAQASLNLRQRESHMRNAYRPDKGISLIKGKNLMIVDDVVTSGSTTHYLAKLLKQYGAKSVEVWALARTPKKG